MVGRSNSQNNVISNVNTGGGHFPHFGMIEANPIRGFGTFGNNNTNPPLGNNNGNNPPPSPLPLPGFERGLGGGFNLLPGGNAEGNAEGLDPNIAALVNALTGTNLGINH